VPAKPSLCGGRSDPSPSGGWSLDVLAQPRVGDDGWRLMKSRADTALEGYGAQDGAVRDRAETPLIVARQNVAVFIWVSTSPLIPAKAGTQAEWAVRGSALRLDAQLGSRLSPG